jgi:hypothetical protein
MKTALGTFEAVATYFPKQRLVGPFDYLLKCENTLDK